MTKLLNANFMRLKRSKIFYVAAIFMVGLALLMIYSNHKVSGEGYEVALEGTLFAFTNFMGIVIACFISLFTGTEYSEGTIRNKIVIGHSRFEVYMANLITNTIVSVILTLIYIAIYVCGSIPITGWFTWEMEMIFASLGCVLLLCVVFSAIFTFIAMLNQNKAVVAVISLIMSLVILFAGSYFKNILAEPEYYEGAFMTEEGVQENKKVKNSRYLPPGTQRDIYEFLDEFLPGGQQLQISQSDVANPYRYMGYSSIIIVVVTGCGIMLFRKKDLK